MVGDEGLGHFQRPWNFAIDNQLSSEDSLANCHWQLSPPTSSLYFLALLRI
jgi:hypothetical protein